VRRQHRPILLTAALIAGVMSALALSGALAAPRVSFLHIAANLSTSPNRYSYYADIAVSPDGDRVVVVWPESYQDYGSELKQSVYLRWASESTGSGWSAPVTVHAGSSSECARWAAVAVTGTNPYTAVVAYITQSPCDSPTSQAVRYRLCILGGACGAVQTVDRVPSLPTNDPGYGSVDVALDGAGQPHFVYAYYRYDSFQKKDVGTVYYRSPSGSNVEVVSQYNQDARTPAIAWNGGAVHVVWATEPLTGSYDGTTENPDYNIYYTEALTVPESAADPIEWAEIRRFGQNPSLHSASPVVAPYLPPSALHVVYLQQGLGVDDWETYYDGNEYDRYSHVYLPIVMRSFR
jgi:hypothetical protein